MINMPEWLMQWLAIGWVQALLIVFASVVVAKLSEWVIGGILARLARRTSTQADDKILGALRRPVFLTVLLTGFLYALVPLEMAEAVRETTGGIVKTFIVLIWLGASFRLCGLLLSLFVRREGGGGFVDERMVPLLDNTGRMLFSGVAAYFVFVIWSIDLTAWLASAGIVGIAIGFAAKDTLGNLFAGIFILIDAPYKVGDFVVLDAGERGQVTHIGIRSTRLLTRDDVEIIIPNSIIGGAKIVNESGGPSKKFRIRAKIGAAYGSDIDQVRSVLEQIALDHEAVCEDPEPRVRLRNFGDSSLDFELQCWIDEPVLRGRVLDALNTAIYKRFHEEGIEIPFPKRDVYIRKDES